MINNFNIRIRIRSRNSISIASVVIRTVGTYVMLQRELAVSYIEKQSEAAPFVAVLAPPAPHAPFTPAPRHVGTFANVTALRHPNFNVAVEVNYAILEISRLHAKLTPRRLGSNLPRFDCIYFIFYL